MADYDALDRMSRTLRGSNPLPPRSPMGAMADDLGRPAQAPPAAPEPPRPTGPGNPNVPPGGSKAALEYQAARTAPPGAAPVTPTAPAAPSAAPSAASKWFGSADDWKNALKGPADSPHKSLRMTAPEAPSKFAKGVGLLQGAMGAKDAYDGIQEGDTWKTGVGAADAVAGAALFTPAAPVAGAYLGLRGAWDGAKMAGAAISDRLSEGTRDTIGGWANQFALNTGLGGVDDSAKMQMDAEQRLRGPAQSSPPAAAPSARPGNTNPYADANAAKIAALDEKNKGVAAPGGITRIDRPGHSPLFTDNKDPYMDRFLARPAGGPTREVDDIMQRMSDKSQNEAFGRFQREANSAQYAKEVRRAQSGSLRQQTLHSGNDWESRNTLEKLKFDASTTFGNRKIYQNAVAMDQLKRAGADPGSVARTTADASRYGSDTSAAASRYGHDTSFAGTKYGADAQLGVKQMEMQYKLRQQQAMGSLFQAAGGDPMKAAQLAANYGLDAKQFTDMAGAQQTRAQANSKDARSTFDNMFVDKDGKRDERAEVQAHQLASQIAPGYENMSPEQRNAVRAKVVDATRVVQGMNSLRNNGWGQAIGWDNPTPEYSQLPDLNGATVGDVGFLEGAVKNRIGKGDTKITLRDGERRYIPAGTLSEAQLRMMQENGAMRSQQ